MTDMKTLPIRPVHSKLSPSIIRQSACFLVDITADAGIDISYPSFLSCRPKISFARSLVTSR